MLSKIITTLFFLFALASCSQEKDAAEKDTIIVATSADNPPYEYIQDGKVIGLDIDVINAVGSEIGKKIVLKNLDFPGLLPALSTNNIDLVIAALTVTPQRKEHMDFSNGYFSSSMSILFRKQENFKTVEDLASKIIGVQMGTTWEAYAKDLVTRFPEMRIRALANNLVLIEELKAGSVDALIMETMQVKKFEQNVEGLENFALVDTQCDFAIALPKNSDLTSLINNAIQKLQSSGKLQTIKEKWIVK